MAAAPGVIDVLSHGGEPPAWPQPLPVLLDEGPAGEGLEGSFAEHLTVEALLRHLPGKRMTLRGQWRQRAVSIKLFDRSRGGERHLRREATAHAWLRAAGIDTPELLARFRTPCGRGVGLLFAWVDDAPPLADIWRAGGAPERQALLRRLLQTFAQLHTHGIRQTDAHLGNFLLQGERLWVLDLGSLRRRAGALSQRMSLDNLGLLGAQLDVIERPRLEAELESYAQARGWPPSSQYLPALRWAVRRAWNRRLRGYLEKALRTCTLTHYQRTPRRLLACRRSHWGEEARRFADDPETFMAAGRRLKSGNTATVVRTTLDGRPVVIKRYNIKHWRHAASRALRDTRAMHSWRAAHLLELAGIPTPQPVMLLEQRRGPLRGVAYLVCEALDAPDLLSLGRQRPLATAELASLEAVLTAMRSERISHGDFKATNLLMAPDGVQVIDLDALRRHRFACWFRRAFARDMARLARNWGDGEAVSNQVAALGAIMPSASARYRLR